MVMFVLGPGTFGDRQVSAMLETYDPDGCQGVLRSGRASTQNAHSRDHRYSAGAGFSGLPVSLLAGRAPGRQVLLSSSKAGLRNRLCSLRGRPELEATLAAAFPLPIQRVLPRLGPRGRVGAGEELQNLRDRRMSQGRQRSDCRGNCEPACGARADLRAEERKDLQPFALQLVAPASCRLSRGRLLDFKSLAWDFRD